jgi:hypothetical protein
MSSASDEAPHTHDDTVQVSSQGLNAPLSAYLLTASCLLVLVTLIYTVWPATRPWIIDEGAVVENISAALAFLTFAVAAALCWRTPERRLAYGAISLLGLGLLLDEISFGHIFLGYAPPVLGGVEIESIHELAHPAVDQILAHPILATLALGLIAGAAALTGIANRIPGWLRMGRRFIRVHPAWFFVLMAVALGSTALIFDLDPAERFIFAEEMLEFCAALALFFAAACIPPAGAGGGLLDWNPAVKTPGFRVFAGACLTIAAVAGGLFGVE